MNYLTKCSVFIELYLDEQTERPGGIGTAFFYLTKYNDCFLITNWHCVTGINPETNEHMSRNGVVNPKIMDVHFLKKGSINEWIVKRIPLLDDNDKRLYLEHPKGQIIDVVAIKLDKFDDVDLFNIWEGTYSEEFNKDITDSCSIIGFPKGISTGGKFPIWKTGSLASEMELNHDGKPMFLIDASTREGMSGSPVYCTKNNIATFGSQFMVGPGLLLNFVGVYAGRIGDDIEIGRVFKGICVEEIIQDYYRKNPPRYIPQKYNYIVK